MIRYFHKYRIMKQEDVILALGALAQETRLQVFRALVRAHSPDPAAGGLAAGALAEALGVAQPTLSFHLKELARQDTVLFFEPFKFAVRAFKQERAKPY